MRGPRTLSPAFQTAKTIQMARLNGTIKRLRKLLIYTNVNMAERVGFEPTCRLPDKTLSRRPRYDHFGTSPGRVCRLRARTASREHFIIPSAASRERSPG